MTDHSMPPFESFRRAALSFTEPQIQSQLLTQLAQCQLETRQFNAALQTLASLAKPNERRSALAFAHLSLVPPEHIESFVQLMQSDKETEWQIGYCALTLLDSKDAASAWKWVEAAQNPFETEHLRYLFLKKILPLINENDWAKVLRLHQRLTDPLYKDWAALEMTQYLTTQRRYEEAESLTRSLSLPTRRSWTFEIMSRLADVPLSKEYWDQAVIELNTAHVDAEKNKIEQDQEAENLAIQLRLLGRTAIQRGKKEQGEQLLERCESIIAGLSMPMQRYKQQCFLGKVLAEIKLISSIQDYVPIETMLDSLSSGMDRCQVFVWLAEAGWQEGWRRAVETLSVPERGITESTRADEMTLVLKRCLHQQRSRTSIDPIQTDRADFSSEESETLYFTPFADTDCGC